MKKIFFKFIITLIMILIGIDYCLPTLVYAENEFWKYSPEKNIYKRYREVDYTYHLYYQIKGDIKAERGSVFKNPEGAKAEENKYLIYYYRPNDKINLVVRTDIIEDGLFEYDSAIYIDGEKSKTKIKVDGATATDNKNTKYCKIEVYKENDMSTEFAITINNTKVQASHIKNNGFWIKADANSYTWLLSKEEGDISMSLIHFIPYCKKMIEHYEGSGYKNYIEFDNSNELESSESQVVKADENGDIYERVVSSSKWSNVEKQEGVEQKEYVVEQVKNDKKYHIDYTLIYIKDCCRIYYKINNTTDVTEMTSEEQTERAENAINDMKNKVKNKAYYFYTTIMGSEDRLPFEFTDVLTNLNYYKPTDEVSDTKVTDKMSIILTTVTNIGMVVAILMIAILGLKYMLGSVEEKAEYKKDMIPYLVGAILLFGITTFVKVLQTWGETINNL